MSYIKRGIALFSHCFPKSLILLLVTVAALVHVMHHGTNTDACTPSWRWYGPIDDQQDVLHCRSQNLPSVHKIYIIHILLHIHSNGGARDPLVTGRGFYINFSCWLPCAGAAQLCPCISNLSGQNLMHAHHPGCPKVLMVTSKKCQILLLVTTTSPVSM